MWWPLIPRMPSNASVPPTWKIPTPSFFVYRVSSCLPVCLCTCLSSVCVFWSVCMSCLCVAECLNWFLCPGVIYVFVYVLVHMYACICASMCVCVWLHFGMNYSFLNGGDQYMHGQTKKMVACTSLPVLVGSHRDTDQCKHIHVHTCTHTHSHACTQAHSHTRTLTCLHNFSHIRTGMHTRSVSFSHTHTHTPLMCFSLIGMCLHFQRCVWQMGHWMLSAATWQTWSARWTPAASEQFSCWQRSTWLRAVSTTQTGYSTIGTAWSVVVVSAVM